HRKSNRIGDSIKWLQQLTMRIRVKGKDKTTFLLNATSLKTVLEHETKHGEQIIAYPDGSTSSRKMNQNSGFGVFITDKKHRPLCEKGGIVRSDGNNFIAEMAAVAMILTALPEGRYVHIYSDSMATIAALEKPERSERKRIRATGRSWKNFALPLIQQQHSQIQFHHIKSHEEVLTPFQQGNDRADKIAK